MFRRVYLGGLCLFFLVLIAPGELVHAVEYGGLGGIPANPDPNNSRTKSIFVYTIASGQAKQDAINVINNTAETKTVEVYATDSEIASGGSFACRQKVDAKNVVGGWIQLSKSEVTLEPNTNQIVPFKVTLPAAVSVGEHNGCLVIQEKSAAPQKAGGGVQLSFRSALRVAITVPGDIKKDVEFTALHIKPESKKYIFTATLTNKGNVSLDTDVRVFVTSWYSHLVYQNGGVYPLLAQKTPVELNFEYPRPFWGGFYKVSAHADYNGDPNERLGSNAPKNVRKVIPTRLLFVMPRSSAVAIELLMLLLLIALVLMIIMRFAGRKKVAKSWHAYTVREGDTVVNLAHNRATKWKTIAKINKLKAPYDLKTGTKIKLPKTKVE